MSVSGLEEVYNCIHCGLCLPECPTYLETRLETESPRGRIHLARALLEGRIEAGERFASHMYLCLGCRACETVCPSDVKFGRILEASRAKVGTPGTGILNFFLNITLKHILPYPGRIRFLARLLRFYQRMPFRGLLRKILPAKMVETEDLLPEVPARFFTPPSSGTFEAEGEKKHRVGFVAGCVMSTIFADVNEATVNVLRRAGCEVVVPKTQTCCGALNLHSGETVAAKSMAIRNIEAFSGMELDVIIVNSAGCGCALKEYGELFDGDDPMRERAIEFGAKIKDFSEFASELSINTEGCYLEAKVTYQDPCHLVHGQGVSAEPRSVIGSMPGIELIEMKDSTRCCGSAGIYNVTQPEMSKRVLDEKIDNIARTGASIVVAPNPGCMMQIKKGLKDRGLDMEALHLVELLERVNSTGNSSGNSLGGKKS